MVLFSSIRYKVLILNFISCYDIDPLCFKLVMRYYMNRYIDSLQEVFFSQKRLIELKLNCLLDELQEKG